MLNFTWFLVLLTVSGISGFMLYKFKMVMLSVIFGIATAVSGIFVYAAYVLGGLGANYLVAVGTVAIGFLSGTLLSAMTG